MWSFITYFIVALGQKLKLVGSFVAENAIEKAPIYGSDFYRFLSPTHHFLRALYVGNSKRVFIPIQYRLLNTTYWLDTRLKLVTLITSPYVLT